MLAARLVISIPLPSNGGVESNPDAQVDQGAALVPPKSVQTKRLASSEQPHTGEARNEGFLKTLNSDLDHGKHGRHGKGQQISFRVFRGIPRVSMMVSNLTVL